MRTSTYARAHARAHTHTHTYTHTKGQMMTSLTLRREIFKYTQINSYCLLNFTHTHTHTSIYINRGCTL